jgi:hypothetical protein
MFHGEDNSRGKKHSAMSQSIDRNGREERKETTANAANFTAET